MEVEAGAKLVKKHKCGNQSLKLQGCERFLFSADFFIFDNFQKVPFQKDLICDSRPRKFKGGIGSLFDPVLTLWGGGHIGSSRMEQSYSTSGFFRQRVTARNHSNYQPTPRRRSIIAYGKCENAGHDKCVAVCVICFYFLAAPFYAFQTFPGKAQLFPCFFFFFFFPLRFKCCD